MKAVYDAQLGHLLEFSEADLRMNSEGRLSPRQKAMLMRCLVPMIGWFVFQVCMAWLLLSILGQWFLPAGIAVLLAGGGVSVGGWFLSAGLRRALELIRDDHVRYTTGVVTRHIPYQSTEGAAEFGVGFGVVVNGLVFRLRRESLIAFDDGHTYTLYYFPQPRVLLSAERTPQRWTNRW